MRRFFLVGMVIMVGSGLEASSDTVSDRLVTGAAGHDRAANPGLVPIHAPESQFRHGVSGRGCSASIMVHVHHGVRHEPASEDRRRHCST